MSDHVVDDVVNGSPFTNKTLFDLVSAVIRTPDSVFRSQDGLSWVFRFTTDLTPAEVTRLVDLLAIAKGHVVLTVTEYDTIAAVYASGKAYLNLASPTTAQTTAAVKGIIRVLGAIFRN